MLTPIVCKLSRVGPIPGADRIKRAEASGFAVVIGADRVDGDLGVLFPAGGVMAREFAEAAGLAHLSGGRVKEITLRGVRSEGVWLPFHDFHAALGKWSKAEPDLRDAEGKALAWVALDGAVAITRDDGAVLYQKYVPAARGGRRPPRGYRVSGEGDAWTWISPTDGGGNASGGPASSEGEALGAAWGHWHAQHPPKPPKDPRVVAAFPEHYETEALFRDAHEIPLGSTLFATLKGHGESFRLGFVAPDGDLLVGPVTERDGVWVGTRRMDFAPDAELPAPDSALGYLARLRDLFGVRLQPGEVVYGEVLGFRPTGAPVMKVAPGARVKGHPYGPAVIFSYGCAADGPHPDGGGFRPGDRWRPMIYRITQDGRELTRAEIVTRCAGLWIEPVPQLGQWTHEDVDATRDRARQLAEGEAGHLPDPLDPRHPREGVCVRWEVPHQDVDSDRVCLGCVLTADNGDHPQTTVGKAYKAKGWLFRALEGLVKDDGHLEREEAEQLGEEVEQ